MSMFGRGIIKMRNVYMVIIVRRGTRQEKTRRSETRKLYAAYGIYRKADDEENFVGRNKFARTVRNISVKIV
jgi:hypothetical protein